MYIMGLTDFTRRCCDKQQLKVLFLSGSFAFQKDSIWVQSSSRLPNPEAEVTGGDCRYAYPRQWQKRYTPSSSDSCGQEREGRNVLPPKAREFISLASHRFQSCHGTFRIISQPQWSYLCVGSLADWVRSSSKCFTYTNSSHLHKDAGRCTSPLSLSKMKLKLCQLRTVDQTAG